MSREPDSTDPELDRSAELIEQLLSDPQLRARFRADPASVLYANGLTELADGLGTGPKALMTLELRESRSSLAGVMVAAAAEGVDVGHIAEHALPHLGKEAGRAVSRLVSRIGKSTNHVTPKAPAPRAPAPVTPVAAKPATPDLAPSSLPKMARPVHHETVAPVQSTEPATTEPAPTTEPTTAEPVASTVGTEAAHHAVESAATGDPANLLQYPGNNASSQQIAAWMGANAQAAGLPAELPVMAALTESGLRNVDYGTADSIGFFQMRTSIWNEGPYAGFYSDPELQMKWFINEALAAKASDPSLADSPSTWGEWVANVERPAAEYRYRYQLQLGNAQDLLKNVNLGSSGQESAASAATGSTAPTTTGEVVSTSGASAQTVVHDSASGTEATSASAGAAAGSATPLPADLQGAAFVRATYARSGLQLPATTAGQFDVGASVARGDLRPGDAVFFGSAAGTPSRVGLYVGNDEVSLGSGGHLESLSSLAKAGERYLGARRYTDKLLTGTTSYARVMPTIKK